MRTERIPSPNVIHVAKVPTITELNTALATRFNGYWILYSFDEHDDGFEADVFGYLHSRRQLDWLKLNMNIRKDPMIHKRILYIRQCKNGLLRP